VEKLREINFENLLRSKIQRQKKTSYLFLGSKTHIMHEMFNNKKRAFYNAASVMVLGPLPEKETVAFLTKRFALFSIALDEETARYIIASAASIPHYIQHLASEIWQCAMGGKGTVNKKLVDYCVERVVARQSDYYIELFDRQSQRKKQLLQALSTDGKNIFSGEYIKKYRLGNVSTVQRAVKELVNAGVVEKTGSEYFIADPFFRRYIIRAMQVMPMIEG
jgi:AAA+ ATPase superfamily predicted ATPase